ncbi:hypothetical protein PMAYCL1PPCAC_18592 [Pristionchus mayeri]|uniref:Uncharacterized protein n=1 Tax=Pristionchus mayeri TaxID=1317129 RepID=A0AAN5CQ65_9BILA|nr:hypothetical protein PMAYCL1PPCAC_18592 [Pristionchus mayeri]
MTVDRLNKILLKQSFEIVRPLPKMTFPNGGFNSGSGWDQHQYAYQSNPQLYVRSFMTQENLYPGADYSRSREHEGIRQDFHPFSDNKDDNQMYRVVQQVVPPSPQINQFPVAHQDFHRQVNSYESFHPLNGVSPQYIQNPSRQEWIPAKQGLAMSDRGIEGRSAFQETHQATPIHVRSSLLLCKNNRENPPGERKRNYSVSDLPSSPHQGLVIFSYFFPFQSTSAYCTSSSSSETNKEPRHPRLSNEELREFAALIQDLWCNQRFAQEFKKYSVSEFNRIRSILQKIESENRHRLL